MPLMSLKNIYYSVSEFPMLDHIQLDVEPKERIALIGRNGEGKSTLLKMINNDIQPESGDIIRPSYLKVSRLSQDLPPADDLTVFEFVAKGLKNLSSLLIDYHALTQETVHDDAWYNQLHVLQEAIELQNGWQIHEKINQICELLKLPKNKKMSELSGGWRRRVALAQALVQEPDILLLDEPTNHLDIEAIESLEAMLLNYPNTLIFITHDRALLKKLATRIIELDRGKLTSFPANYDDYVERKEKMLAEEERHNALFDKKLSEEEAWLRQGVKARRTRNEGRVRALKALREERKLRRTRKDKPEFDANIAQTAGKMIIQAQHISFGYIKDKPLVRDFSFNIQRGDKIAVAGVNGAGKTTLIKLLLGYLKPTTGSIKHSPTMQVAFFDQNREQIKDDETVMANVAQGDDFIEIGNQRKHVIGYLGDFLFSPAKCRSLARTLSGGEKNRLMLAKLFSRPANVLVLDEPTNDLDIESLDVLENLLLNFNGTVIMISHDRAFIDNVATHCIVFEKNKKISIHFGGYSDWRENQEDEVKPRSKESKTKTPVKPTADKKKLSFNEQRELTELPAKIEKLEKEMNRLQNAMCQSDFYNQPKEEVLATQQKLAKIEGDLQEAYARWELLDN